MKRNRLLLPLFLLAAIPFAPTSHAGSPLSPSRGAVFRIDGKPVAAGEFLLFTQTLYPGEYSRGIVSAAWLADAFLNNRLLASRAVSEEVDRLPEVRSRIESRRNALWVDPYWADVVRATVHVGEEELRALAPGQEETVTLRLLLSPDRREAEALRMRARSGEDFPELVRKHSTGLSSGNGGRLGPVGRGSETLELALIEELFRTPPGGLTPVVETRFGFAFALVLDRKDREAMIREWLASNRTRLVRERETVAWKSWKEDLVRSHRIVVDESVVEAVVEAGNGVPLPADLLARPAFRVDDMPFFLEDLLDPSGIGMLHGADVLRTVIRKRAEEFAIARDAARKGLRERHPEILAKETILRENLLAREYLRFRTRNAGASGKEQYDYFEANRERFFLPAALDLSFIETKSPERAARACESLAAGKPFGEVAEAWSDNRETRGGRVGLVEESRLAPELDSVRRMKVGDTSRVPLRLRSKDTGEELLVIARLNDVRERRPLRFEEVDRRILLQAVVAAKREAIAREILLDLRKTHRVEITPEFRDLARSDRAPADETLRGKE